MTYNDIKNMYLAKGYKFRESELGLNIFGIRSKESQSNKFDDKLGVAWVEKGVKNLMIFSCTTDPGKHWLLNPMNINGCAIMVPGQNIECYAAGKHNGQYDAFIQVKKMAFVRDNNKDTKLDFELYRNAEKAKTAIFWDIIGANIHRAHLTILQWFVEKYSAGCQVIQKASDFDLLLKIRDRSIAKGYKRFDYTLFEQ